MKNSIQIKIRALLASLAMLVMVGNCDIINPPKEDDSTGLALLAFLATQGSSLQRVENPTVGEAKCDSNPTNVVEKSGTINAAETWSGFIRLSGTVTANAPITVEAGTVIYGQRGSSLFVLGANKLTAIGTAANPICWTSSNVPGARQPSDWGGIVVVGNSGASRSSTTEGTTPQNYGGAAGADANNLEMRYNIVEFAGNEVAPGDELNGISMYASNTILNHVQVHRGLDDSFEQWGGNLAWTNVIATGGLDDDFDLDEGVQGTISNAIAHKYPAACGGQASTDPHGLEWDGIHNNGTPLCGTSSIGRCTTVTLNKFTLLGANIEAGQAARLRERVKATLTNGLFYGFASGFDARNVASDQTGTEVTMTNVRGDKDLINFTNDASSAGFSNNLGTTLPIVSDAGINTASNCGFSANKPDYTLISGVAATGFGAAADGKFWENWTVYRAR